MFEVTGKIAKVKSKPKWPQWFIHRGFLFKKCKHFFVCFFLLFMCLFFWFMIHFCYFCNLDWVVANFPTKTYGFTKRYALLAHWKPEKFLKGAQVSMAVRAYSVDCWYHSAQGFSQDLQWKGGHLQYHASAYNNLFLEGAERTMFYRLWLN